MELRFKNMFNTDNSLGREPVRFLRKKLTVEELHRLVVNSMEYFPLTGEMYWSVDYFYPIEREICTKVGSKSNGKYSQACILGKSIGMHKLIWFHQTGVWAEVVDHVNGIMDDNRWCNLRAASYSENNFNKRRQPRILKDGNRWRVRPITKNGKRYSFPKFNTEQEAAAAYEAKAVELYGDFYLRGQHQL